MSWFLNLSTRSKLFVSFGLMILFILVVGGTAYQGIRMIQESEKRLYEEDYQNSVALYTLESDVNRSRAELLTMLTVSDEAEWAALEQKIQESSKAGDEMLQRLFTSKRNDPAALGKLQELKTLRDKFTEVRDEQVVKGIKAKKLDEAKNLQPDQTKRYQKIVEIIHGLATDSEQTAKASVDQSAARANQAVWTFAIVTACALALALALAVFLNRIIANPLGEITGVARRIAEGDLKGRTMQVRSDDEIGQLGGVFNGMLSGLRTLTQQVLDVTQNINSASAEIMASTQQQASSTKEQAATVQEITATMEEVSQSGSQISAKAKQVAAAAEATSAASNAGLQAVQDTTRTMAAIREQVEEVAGNIVALSEKTQAVGEIIATVNDIAERSNLLALNAAIEAASVGDQGNRFAVVANEMKNLADQAKDSTVQVRTILGDIQKGINSSVMFTEEAVKRVEAGKQKADVAEQTIRQMASTTLESVQAFEQIIGAGNQQQIGFEQVAQGMKDIRQAVGQTAAATAQLEKAVASLNALSHELKKTVGRYQL